MLDRTVFADEVFGLHAQQAVEKGLKAVFAAMGRAYPRTHDLEALVGLLNEAGVAVPPPTEVTFLTDFAVQFRYEPYDDAGTGFDRELVISRVQALLVELARLVDRT